MNIAIFTDTYFPDINGVASSISTMVDGLQQKGHKVIIFSISEPSHKIKLVQLEPLVYRIPSVSVFFLKPYRTALPVLAGLLEICKKNKIDLLHTHTEFSMGIIGGVIAETLGIPQIHTYHTMLEDYTHYIAKGKLIPRSLVRKYSEIFCNNVDSLIVPTEKVKEAVLTYGVTDTPINVIPSGINLKPFNSDNYDKDEIADIRKSFGLAPNDKVLLSIGRVACEKSIDIVIKAMPKIVSFDPSIKFVVIGLGPALDDLKNLANELGVSSNVIFAGSVPFSEVGKYYQIGDVFISCSTSETQGLTYYEALASGLPVIARYDKCIADILEDGVNSKVFRNVDELPEYVHSMFNGPLDSMRIAAKQSVHSFNSDVFADRIESVYITTLTRTFASHEMRDKKPIIHIAHQLRSHANSNMTKINTNTRKIIVPIVRKGHHISRKIRYRKAI